jgi:UDPglucose--hexose-1-phosphate uridylyltransferase
MTPPAVLVYLKSNGGIRKSMDKDGFRHKNWLIRCVPNLYPAFAPPKEKISRRNVFKSDSLAVGVGHHEVLIESPNHNEHPADAEIHQLIHVVNAYVDRLKELSSKPYVRYVSIFRNHGLEAGASLSHAHSQIIATPFVPQLIKDEMKASRKFWKRNGKCVFCEIIEKESAGPRLIIKNPHFVAFAPYASVHPMEFWITPRRHEASPLELSQKELEAFAETLKTCFSGLKNLVNNPPYNYGFHLTVNRKAEAYYHWHVEVYPKLAIWAGFEKSTGVYINTITPEVAAESFRRAVAT